jgi:flagella basal body P-ring formation protein FlgA
LKKIFIFVCLFVCLVVLILNLTLDIGHWSFVSPCLALDNPEQKVTETIKNYIVKKYPGWAGNKINLTYRMAEGVFSELKKLPESASLGIIEVYADFKPVGSAVFPLQASFEGSGAKYMIRAKVEILQEIVAAARRIKKGTLIGRDDLKLEERDVALLPQKYFTGPDLLISQEAKISVPENSTIFNWMIGEVPLVHRGDILTLIVNAPGLSVRVKAKAEEDGLLGQEIKVKRADSNKILAAKILSANEVEVKL